MGKRARYKQVDEIPETPPIQPERKKFKPLTENQAQYFKTINRNCVTFCVGCAGTGKTYISVACAIGMLLRGEVEKIILVRPAIECDEKLGYIPGVIDDKMAPYTFPMFNSMEDFLTVKEIHDFQEAGIIKICPLAYMKGTTFKRSIVLLDEAQNCTYKQLKMFLTRLGEGSKMIINGDSTQTDIKEIKCDQNPLLYCMNKLSNIDGIGIIKLGKEDIVRHTLIEKVLEVLGD
jgi:phosphate starvation-inducible protein PhoH and related proteins